MKELSLKLGHEDKEHIQRMHNLPLGCLVCGKQSVHFHHTLFNRYSTQKQTDHAGIMLCEEHHQYLHYSSKGGVEFFYILMYNDLIKNIQKNIEEHRRLSREFHKGSELGFMLKQASFIFALQSVNMDDIDLILSYREIQWNNQLLFKDRMFNTNICTDLEALKQHVKV